MPHRGRQLEALRHRRDQFGKGTEHVARAAGRHLGRVVPEAHFAVQSLRERAGAGAVLFMEGADTAPELHRTARQHHQFGRSTRLQAIDRRPATVPVAGVLRVRDGLLRRGTLLARQGERIHHAVERTDDPAAVAVAVVQAAPDDALGVGVGDVVVPSRQRARHPQHRMKRLGAVVGRAPAQVGKTVAGQHPEIAVGRFGVVVAAGRDRLIEIRRFGRDGQQAGVVRDRGTRAAARVDDIAEQAGIAGQRAVERGDQALPFAVRVDLDVAGVVVAARRSGHEVLRRTGAVGLKVRIDRVEVEVEHIGRDAEDRRRLEAVPLPAFLEEDLAAARELPLGRTQLRAPVGAGGQHHVVAVGLEIAVALGHADVGLARTTARIRDARGADAVGGAAPGDEVDDAGDRIRAVQRRRAVGQHLDALDRRDRDAIEVDGVRRAGQRLPAERRQPPPVEQHQRAVLAEVVDRDAGESEALGTDRTRFDRRAHDGRQVLDEIGSRRVAAALDRLALDHLHRQRRLGIDAADRRARDLDTIE